MRIPESELILNPDGSIYHLHLLPEDLADTVITVGDPDRVNLISARFDTLEVKKQHREFRSHTGTYKGKRLTVISTGIGPDNIDIVCNELDALVNIDLKNRSIKSQLRSLEIIRVGTSGGLQPDVAVDSIVSGGIGIGFDNLLHFYGGNKEFLDYNFAKAFITHMNWNPDNAKPYVVHSDPGLLEKFSSEDILQGITTTNVGFYGPQGRVMRLPLHDPDMNAKIASFEYEGRKITNLEMETAAIYGMSRMLGHKALSLNIILANRANGTFSASPRKAIERLVTKTLDILVQ
ncbi:MAG: nucleoside phosphorylase [Bacteroidia bacterium]|nr:nucleoside phosphorylase [Bacteroidia bacterium]NNF31407.1 nucleoside phosphorylase [Flavobacteriaceae bacterium]MBT8275926.1 nucleoside phosphorylase [Bacteroidia bacterium]NNJ82820.1 nucleoside phosphorylase [Flavobacteriaceae bacterium]NNK53001.1 nucleoside phosphorylase [Flavobacteriaceae bacterium]